MSNKSDVREAFENTRNKLPGLTTPDEFARDWLGAMNHAGLTWEPELGPVYDRQLNVIEDKRGIYQSESGQVLDIRSDRFAPLLHKTHLGSVVDVALNTFPTSSIDRVLVREDCKGVSVVLDLGHQYNLFRDSSKTFSMLAVTTRHDGTGSLDVTPFASRAACTNTLPFVAHLKSKSTSRWAVRHTTNFEESLEQLRGSLRTLDQDFEAWEAEMAMMAITPVYDDFRLLTALLPQPEMLPNETAQEFTNRTARLRKAQDTVYDMWVIERTAGNHNVWGFYNAYVEWFDHHRTSRGHAENRTWRALHSTNEKVAALGRLKAAAGIHV